ncbi:MAG: PAS domain-containing protein [Candidatus Cloacimonetes bacterium]|nr:PAS domain-containing protein [Candidatus Cloacimonadota bacterium]
MANESMLLTLINNLDLSIRFYDLQGKILLFNNIAAASWGGKPADFAGKKLSELYSEKYYQTFNERVEITKESLNSQTYLDTRELSPGNIHWYRSTYSPMFDDDGHQTGVLIVTEDITSQKRTEKDKITSETAYQTLFEHMAQGVFYQKADGQLTDVNQAALDIFGISKDEFLGRTSLTPEWRVIDTDGNLITGDAHPSMKALKSGKPVSMTVGIFNPLKQDYVWVIANGIPQYHELQEEPYQVFITMHDITRQRQAEEEIKKYQKNLESLVKDRTLELEEKNIDLQSFNKLFVGREFRIKELRDEVAKLKAKLTEHNIRF